jgi:hypothetical protein
VFPWSPIEEVVQELCAQRDMKYWGAWINVEKAYLSVKPAAWSSGFAPLVFKVYGRERDGVSVIFDDVMMGQLMKDETGWVGPVSVWLDRLQVLEVMGS